MRRWGASAGVAEPRWGGVRPVWGAAVTAEQPSALERAVVVVELEVDGRDSEAVLAAADAVRAAAVPGAVQLHLAIRESAAEVLGVFSTGVEGWAPYRRFQREQLDEAAVDRALEAYRFELGRGASDRHALRRAIAAAAGGDRD